MCSRDSKSRPLCPWNPHPNRLYALRLALVVFSSTLVWTLCFIVVVLMIPKWVACSTSGMVIFPILSFSLVVPHCLLFPLMWIATLFFGCNSYPSRFAKSRAMLTMICASLSWVQSSAMAFAHPVLLTLMFPIFSLANGLIVGWYIIYRDQCFLPILCSFPHCGASF